MIVRQLTICVLIVATNGHLRLELAESDKAADKAGDTTSTAKISLDPQIYDPHRRYRSNFFGEVASTIYSVEGAEGSPQQIPYVATILDRKYADWLLRWSLMMNDLGVENERIVVVAFDTESQDSASRIRPKFARVFLEVSQVRAHESGKWDSIGYVKAASLFKVAKWLRRPFFCIEQDVLVFRQFWKEIDTSRSDVASMFWNWGPKNNRANFGFVFFSDSNATLHFLRKVSGRLATGGWDQAIFNDELQNEQTDLKYTPWEIQFAKLKIPPL